MTVPHIPVTSYDPAALPTRARNAAAQALRGIVPGLALHGVSVDGPWETLDASARAFWEGIATSLVQVALAEIDPQMVTSEHVLRIAGDTWAVQHPLLCRPALHECDVHRALTANELLTWDLPDGEHVVRLVDGQLTHQAGGEFVPVGGAADSNS